MSESGLNKGTVILAHLASWMLLNCLVVGAYVIYQNGKAFWLSQGDMSQLVASLDTDGKNQLAEALFASQDEPEKKKKG